MYASPSITTSHANHCLYYLCYCNAQLVHEAAYGENTPLGGSLYAADLDALCPTEVIAYRNRVFTAGNLRVAVSGNASAKDLKALTESTLSTGFAEGANAASKNEFVGGDVRVRANTGRTRAALAFKGSGKCIISDICQPEMTH
jgi:predicted Zn-dependent peptidase